MFVIYLLTRIYFYYSCVENIPVHVDLEAIQILCTHTHARTRTHAHTHIHTHIIYIQTNIHINIDIHIICIVQFSHDLLQLTLILLFIYRRMIYLEIANSFIIDIISSIMF